MKKLINKYIRQPICQSIADMIIFVIPYTFTHKQAMEYYGMGLMLETYAIYHGITIE